MLPLLPSVAVSLLLATPLGSLAAEVGASDDALMAHAATPAGDQLVLVQGACIPDWASSCDTTVDCTPGTLNCWATRTQRESWTCTLQPDGSMRCVYGNQPSGNETAGNQTGP